MHRLQFEEAQQSSYAITPASAGGEVRDESESESLAAEFQSLLAQLTGQITAIPDQAMAIGLALAQTAAPERLKPAEIAPIEHDTTVNDGQGEELAGETHSSKDGVVSDFLDSRAEQWDERQTALEDSVTDDIPQNLVLDTSTLDDTAVLVDEVTQIVEQKVVQEVAQVASYEVAQDVDINQALVLQRGLDDSSSEKLVEDSTNERSGDRDPDSELLADSSVRVAVVAQQGAEKKVEEVEVIDETLLPGMTPQLENRENRGEIRKGANTHAQVKESVAGDIQSSQTPEVTTSGQQGDQRRFSSESGQQRSQNFDDALLGQRQKITEVDKNSALQDRDSALMQAPEFGSAIEPRREGMRPDNTIQMALLRQAFESLRGARSDGGDSARMRQQAQSIQSTGAVAEAKSNQGDGSARLKSLTRPQIGRMLERVESTLKEAARGRDGKTISLHLEPVDLGKVKVDVSLRDGTLHARISPDNQQVAQALRDHAHELQGALRKLGLEVDSVTVSVTLDDFGQEMNTGQQMMDGRSFQDERNNMPFDRAQVAENTIGNELAVSSKAGADSERLGSRNMTDHWIA